MQTFAKILIGAAALGVGALATVPALADGYYDDGPGWGRPAPYGYDRPDYRYDRPGAYDRPEYEVRTGAIAICPPGYHLGRHGSLCWPN